MRPGEHGQEDESTHCFDRIFSVSGQSSVSDFAECFNVKSSALVVFLNILYG